MYAISEDSDQTARMRRLISVFTGRKSLTVGFVVRWLYYQFQLATFSVLYFSIHLLPIIGSVMAESEYIRIVCYAVQSPLCSHV